MDSLSEAVRRGFMSVFPWGYEQGTFYCEMRGFEGMMEKTKILVLALEEGVS